MNHFSSFGCVLQKDEHQSASTRPQQSFVEEDLPEFHKAAAKGNLNALSSLWKKDNALLELRSPDGLTPLAQAVQGQQLEAVKLLIKMGADVNAQDNVGRTCLSVAAYQGWHDGVVCLLHNGARQDICDKSGRYPLHAATYHSDVNTLSLLLHNLTSKEVNQPDHEQMTAVHWAAFHDRPDHLMQLFQKGGDILAKDVDGKLPLHWAAQNGSFQCAHRLTSMKDGLATVNAFDKSLKSPAHYAAAAGSANILTIFSHCDNINLELEDPDERTPLHWAAAMGHTKVVEALLKLGVNPFPTDVDGCTPLDYAIQGENEACVKMMESVLGLKSNKLSISRQNSEKGGRLELMGAEAKYRYKKGTSPKPIVDTLPHINIMPPTTTITATDQTTVPTTIIDIPEADVEAPRMYSASTDTDAYEFHNHHKSELRHRHHHPNGNGGGGQVLASLINSSFMAGAHGPVLSKDLPHESKRAESKDLPHESKRAESKDLPQDSKRAESKDTREESAALENNRWGHKTGSVLPSTASRPGDIQELKVMTSTNTPDLNRVSVQSFRSIPPISDRSDILPDHISRGNRRNSRNSPANGNLTQRAEVKLPPLNPDRKVSHFGNQPIIPVTRCVDKVKKTSTQHAMPHDFMTENIAETRILTRMWQHAAREVITQLQPSRRMVIPPLIMAGKDSVKPNSNTTSALQSNRSSMMDEPATSALTKHSRIPSTKMLPTTRNSDPHFKRTRDKTHRKRNNINVGHTPYGIEDCPRDKYLEDEGSSKPLTPTPLMSIQITKNSVRNNRPSEQLINEQAKNKLLRSKVNESQGSKSKRNLQRLSNKFGNVAAQENRPVEAVEEKIMEIPSIMYKGDNKRKDGRRHKHDRKVVIAHQVAYS